MNQKGLDENPTPKEPVEGIVTPGKCDACGHHEIGITGRNGTYLPLRPGMKIRITEGIRD